MIDPFTIFRIGASILAVFAAVIGLAVGLSVAKRPGKGWKGNALRGALIGGLLFILLLLLDPISMPAALFVTEFVSSPIGITLLTVALMIWAWLERARLRVFIDRFGMLGRASLGILAVAMIASVVSLWISEFHEELTEEATTSTQEKQPQIKEFSDKGLWVAGDFDQFEPAQTLDASGLNCPLPILRAKKSLHSMQPGDVLLVIATDPGSLKDFGAFCRQTGTTCLAKKEQGDKFYYLLQKR